MLYKGINWFICIFVAVAIASTDNGPNSITGSNQEATVYHLRTNSLEQSTVGPVQEAKETAAGNLEPPADTSSVPPTAASGTAAPATHCQPQSDHTDRGQTPASTTTATALCPIPPANDPTVSVLRLLSTVEKGRRLREAAKSGNVTELQALLAAGAEVEARNWDERTALHWAAIEGRVEAARCLLINGAAVNASSNFHLTPLHWAAAYGHAAVVRLLLASHADPNVRDMDGMTPLHFAAPNGWTDVATALLEAGANRTARDYQWRTPLGLAREYGRQQLIDMLS